MRSGEPTSCLCLRLRGRHEHLMELGILGVLPTFLIIGAAKAGTTSLCYYLSLHPEIFVYRDREPHFFAADLRAGVPVGSDAVRSLVDYEKLFEGAFRVRGESSPAYSQHPARPDVAQRIHSLIPEARLIYIVRDPISRLVSHYMHQVIREGESRPLSDAIGDINDPSNIYICAGRYGTQLREYLKYFDSQQIFVVDQSMLESDRGLTLHQVFSFLSVDAGFSSPEFDRELNTAAEVTALLPGYRLAYGPLGSRLRTRLPSSVRGRVRRGLDRLAGAVLPAPERPSVDSDLRERLTNVFGPEVAQLRELTGLGFDTWSL